MLGDGQQANFIELYLETTPTAAPIWLLPSQDLMAMEALFHRADMETTWS